MESEKVKEIKNWLYERSDGKLLDNSYNLVGITYGDILTLINELESENKRLNKSDTSKEESSIEYYNLYKDLKSKYKNLENNYDYAYELYKKYEKEVDKYKCLYETMYRKYCKLEAETYTKEDFKEFKDRIAELEKKNAKLLDSVETVQSNRCVYKCVLTKEHLKKFAKKFELNIGKHLKKKYSDYQKDSFYYIVDKADVDMCLDETLKECLCEK